MKALDLKGSLISGLQRLPNGNTVITNMRHGHTYGGETLFPHVFEVTQDKKLVWQFYADCSVNVIHILDTEGDIYKGELLKQPPQTIIIRRKKHV